MFTAPAFTRFLLIVSTLICIGATGAAEPHPQDSVKEEFDKLFNAPAWDNARWGVVAVNLTTSEVLYSRDAEKGFMPASNMKLYTTAAALATMSKDFKYETKIYANGPIRNGVLKGDLLIVGSGDPSISGRYDQHTSTTTLLKNWARAIRNAGIRKIEGSVIGDDDIFTDEGISGSWQADYLQEWYAAESTGLAINDNCWDVILKPGAKVGEPAKLEPVFSAKYVTFKNEVKTTGSRRRPDEDVELTIDRKPATNEVTLSGFIPIDMKQHSEWGAVYNGTLFAATLVADELERQGVRVAKGPKDIDDLKDKAARRTPEKLKLLHTHISPPLSRIVQIINKPSQNFYADMLHRTLGARFYGTGSFSRGERVVADYLTTAGVRTTSLNMADGSGLSRQDMVEPQMTITLLRDMTKRAEFQAFYDSLPIAGVDGTIRRRMRNTICEGNVHAKTGFIGRVRSLSGYVDNQAKERIVFCMMANNYTVPTSQANDTQDSACLVLARTGVVAAPESTQSVTDEVREPADATTTATDIP